MGVLDGKAVAVTGGGRGLGEAYARFAAEEGAAVVVNDIDGDPARDVADGIVKDGGRAVAHVADVADWDAAKSIVQRCVAEFGALDGVVNNAGAFSMSKIQEGQVEADIRRMVDTNVLGSYFVGAHAVRQMVDQGRGSIVNVSSGASCGFASMSAYAATKGAASSLTYSWAMDLAGTGVRVNAICPQARTRMAAHMLDYLGVGGAARGEAIRYQSDPEANAPVAVYLLSDLSGDLNGQVVRIVDGDLGLLSHPAIAEPSYHRRDGWTVEDVARVFVSDLAARQLPLGVVRADIASFRPLV